MRRNVFMAIAMGVALVRCVTDGVYPKCVKVIISQGMSRM